MGWVADRATNQQSNMNTRANIMYFIEHFLDMANKDGHADYVRMMQRDIIRVVDAVAPDDGSGAANVKVVRKVSLSPATLHAPSALPVPRTDHPQVLHALQNKCFLETQAVTQIEEVLRDRDASAQDIAMSSPPAVAGGNADGADHLADTPPARTLPPYGKRGNAPMSKLDRKQIEQRIEEDRERHKRERENIWAISAADDAELEKLWEETSDLGEDDHRMGDEEWAEWKAEDEARKCPHRRESGSGTH